METALFTIKGQEVQVPLSKELRAWIDKKEEEVIYMAWNDAFTAINVEAVEMWTRLMAGLMDSDTYIRKTAPLLQLRDELQRLAKYENMEGEE